MGEPPDEVWIAISWSRCASAAVIHSEQCFHRDIAAGQRPSS